MFLEMKIAVIGYSGSGKSTISEVISKKYALPLLYLDTVHFLPRWKKRSLDEEKEIVRKFLIDNENWIIDGDYFDIYFNERLEQADKIILLIFNRFSCLFRAYRRYVKYKDKKRDSISPQCDEVVDFAFIKHILFERKKDTKEYEKVIENNKSKILIIRNQKELDEIYKKLDEIIIPN